MSCKECEAAWIENKALLAHRAECYDVIAKREEELAALREELAALCMPPELPALEADGE